MKFMKTTVNLPHAYVTTGFSLIFGVTGNSVFWTGLMNFSTLQGLQGQRVSAQPL